MKCCAFEKIEDPKKKAILNKINGIGLGLFGNPVIGPSTSPMGTRARLTRFQSPTVTGSTGLMLRMLASPFAASLSKVNLNGRLISELIGFCEAERKSEAVAALKGAARSANVEIPSSLLRR